MSRRDYLEILLILLSAIFLSCFIAFKSQYELVSDLEHSFVNQSENLVVIKNAALQLPFTDAEHNQEILTWIASASEDLKRSYDTAKMIERDFPEILWLSDSFINETELFYSTVSPYLNYLSLYVQHSSEHSNLNLNESDLEAILGKDVHDVGVVIHEHLMGMIFATNSIKTVALTLAGLMIVSIIFLYLYDHVIALRASKAELRKLLIKSEQASLAKSQFLATMSHELRTPMNGVLGMAEVLRDGELSEENKEIVNQITESGSHLMVILDDILDYSDMSQNRAALKASEFSASSLLSPVNTIFTQEAKTKGLRFELDNRINSSLEFEGDEAKIRQVIFNLVSNAVKFTEKGKVSLIAEYNVTSGYLNFIVEDTGKGIPEDRVSEIFTAFEQIEKGSTRGHDGVGLGLTVVKQICDLMGGEITVTSRIKSGSRFHVTLPTRAVSQLDSNANRATYEVTSSV